MSKCTVSKSPPENEDTSPVPTNAKRSDGQYADHWTMCEKDIDKQGLVKPIRKAYVHLKCGRRTIMPEACAKTYACNPGFYGSTFCCGCGDYFPVGVNGEFIWDDGSNENVGT